MTYKGKPVLFLDIETYSSEDIKSAGLYRYAEADDFEVLLIQYAFGDDPVRVLDLKDPADNDRALNLATAIIDPDIVKVAHNAAFERTCLGRWTGRYLPPEEWIDTMILCSYNGLPASLDQAGAALNLPEQKLAEGKALINYFCRPCKPTKANGGRTRNLPEHAPEKWERFKVYGRRDVEVEREIYRRLIKTPVTPTEERVRCLDARIVERGVMIDRDFVAAAIDVDTTYREQAEAEMRQLTGLPNPNSPAQLKAWLQAAGIPVDCLDKKAVSELLGSAKDKTVRRVLTLRQHLGKTSTTKYPAMERAACRDGRVRWLLQYYGAARTGRWAGRLVQVQNLPQNHLDDIGDARELVRSRDLESLELLYDNIPDTLSQLIRTAFVAKPGHTFLVADYHAIEAVCIAYLAKEAWRLDVFATHGKIYEASYSQAFGVPFESVKKGSPERQKGKIMELALGYGGGPSALLAFGADKLGLSTEELQTLVDKWRAASPKICAMWRECEKAAKAALASPGIPKRVSNGCTYIAGSTGLRCVLPSRRALTYWGAHLEDGSITFMAQNQLTRKWEKSETWGGKLVENIVQAYARDILAEAMLRLEDAGFPIVFTVHDEIITEMPEGSRWEDQAEIMGQPVSWAPGLDRYLHADGYATKFYRKD